MKSLRRLTCLIKLSGCRPIAWHIVTQRRHAEWPAFCQPVSLLTKLQLCLTYWYYFISSNRKNIDVCCIWRAVCHVLRNTGNTWHDCRSRETPRAGGISRSIYRRRLLRTELGQVKSFSGNTIYIYWSEIISGSVAILLKIFRHLECMLQQQGFDPLFYCVIPLRRALRTPAVSGHAHFKFQASMKTLPVLLPVKLVHLRYFEISCKRFPSGNVIINKHVA